MDTKTPPILQKPIQDKSQFKKHERVSDVFLPPLTPHPNHHHYHHLHQRSKQRSPPRGPWPQAVPNATKNSQQKYQQKRPYRILHIGATPLMHACQQGDRSRVLRLLNEQQDTIDYRDRTLRSALHYCMDAGTGGAVASAAPELVNAPDAEGHTPLHLAVIAGDTQLVAVLLANGADVNAKDLEGHSVLHWATVCGEAECVRLVLSAGARPSTPDLRGGSPLHYAAQCCGTAVTAELAVPKKLGLKVLQTLLEFGADVNAKDEDGRQPILWAASAGSVDAVLALARAGGSATAGASDKDGLTALHCAASRGHARCIEALVNLCGAQPDHVDDNGCSALHYATTLGHADATSLILKLGADPNRQDRKGRTPALCAAAKGQLETLKILAQHGASLHARTVRGTGVAHEAVTSGRVELIKWLAKKRPSILDVATQEGKTPLHVAALHGHLDACKVLLDHGVKINAVLRTSKGNYMTALDAALYRGYRDCAKLIQMHGGTTAQQLRVQKITPKKAVTSKLHLKCTMESSTDEEEEEEEEESSPRRRSERKHKQSELYCQEQKVKERTKSKESLKKSKRRDSRSFSEEEVRVSKTLSKKDPQRRARSESARYEESNDPEHKRKENKKRISKHKMYSESSSDSQDSDRFQHKKNDKIETTICRKMNKTQDKGSDDDDSCSVSDDSLEVVVVKRSLEKTSEKVVSGRRSGTPKECMKKIKVTRTRRRSSRRRINNKSKRTTDDDEDDNDVDEGTEKPATDARKSFKDDSQAEVEGKNQNESDDRDGTGTNTNRRYQRDVTDSTSQETVEQVVVTAIVHKNQPPDTPKSIIGTTKEVTFEDTVVEREPPIEQPTTNEIDSPIETNENSITQGIPKIQVETVPESMKETTKSSSLSEDSQLNDPTEKDEIKEERKAEIVDNFQRPTNRPQTAKLPRRESKELKRRNDLTLPRKRAASLGEIMKMDYGGSRFEKSERDLSDDNEMIDSACGKSVDISLESRDLEGNSSVEEKNIQTPEQLRSKEDQKHTSRDDANEKDYQLPKSNKRSSIDRHRKRSSDLQTRESSDEHSPDTSAIVAVIESPEDWGEDDDEEEEEQVDKEIRDVIGENVDIDTEVEDDDGVGAIRVLPSTSEEGTFRNNVGRTDILPQVQMRQRGHSVGIQSPKFKSKTIIKQHQQRRDSGGRDSGIEPSPRISRIPRRRIIKCCPNTEKQQALRMETITRDVQISLRRYHLERKIFFQLMELKRLQIRHGKTNEHVFVKRQVEAFHKAGTAGPALGVAKYDQPYTFRHFEAFLYEQLRKLQRRSATPDFCTQANQCTQKTHRCHHATSAYTSVPVYTYLGGSVPEKANLLPKIENQGKGHMTVEVTHGEEKQVIALPSERLDKTKKYFVTFTVRGDNQNKLEKPKTSHGAQRNAKSV